MARNNSNKSAKSDKKKTASAKESKKKDSKKNESPEGTEDGKDWVMPTPPQVESKPDAVPDSVSEVSGTQLNVELEKKKPLHSSLRTPRT